MGMSGYDAMRCHRFAFGVRACEIERLHGEPRLHGETRDNVTKT